MGYESEVIYEKSSLKKQNTKIDFYYWPKKNSWDPFVLWADIIKKESVVFYKMRVDQKNHISRIL